MKQVKIIFIALELCAIIGVVMLTFSTDWEFAIRTGNDFHVRLLIVLCAAAAIVCQREQQYIEWDERENENENY
jgi:hypothetical protein